MGRLNPGRRAALKALIAVEDGAYAEEELSRLAPDSGSDRGLAWHLCLGTLRLQGSIDSALKPHLRTPIGKLDVAVRCALRLGTFECTQSRTPARAAVDQAVEAVRAVGYGRASGFVNAVLRKVADANLDTSADTNLPSWLAERWKGYDEWIARIQVPARINLAGDECPTLEGCVPASVGGQTVPKLWQVPTGLGQVSTLPGFKEGRYWVMDPAAAHVADILSRAMGASGTILDACAAPGGKSFRLAQHGHAVTALDRDQKRLERMAENLERLHLSIDMVRHDWMGGSMKGLGLFDGVLVDAPCSALGTVRRHPEILWRRRPGDVPAMAVAQRTILAHASEHVRPGGVLVYAVCSTEPEEGIKVAESLEGWKVSQKWDSVPPRGDEDAFQAFLLEREKV